MIGTTESIPIDTERFDTVPTIELPPPSKWVVHIPAGGLFHVYYPKLSAWQRFWMRFIGWGVKPYAK